MTLSVVTGGAGFIGSNLADGLLEKGHEVRVFDNFTTGTKENLQHIKNDIEIVRGDIRNLEQLKQTFKNADYVFHQAALASVTRSIEDPKTSLEVNINGTLNVLMAAKQCNVKRVVFASSSSVYGGDPALPKRETMKPAPISPYAVAKVTCEHLCKVFHDIYGLETVSLRYFNVFGPRQDPGSEYAAVIPKFISLMMGGKQPIIYGDGSQTRDFTYVSDVVNANMLAAKAQNADGTAMNIACGKQISINSLVEKLNEILGKNIKPAYRDARSGDPKDSLADITMAKERLGYNPRYAFNDGLKETVNWFERAKK